MVLAPVEAGGMTVTVEGGSGDDGVAARAVAVALVAPRTSAQTRARGGGRLEVILRVPRTSTSWPTLTLTQLAQGKKSISRHRASCPARQQPVATVTKVKQTRRGLRDGRSSCDHARAMYRQSADPDPHERPPSELLVVLTEWLGKIRVFLRKHGWVPHDEARLHSGPVSSR